MEAYRQNSFVMQNKPRLLIIGPIFNTASGPSGQGGKLYLKFKEEGYQVYKKSSIRSIVWRMLDTMWGVCQWWKYDIILLQSFSLKSFYLQDAVSLLAGWLKKPVVFTLRGGAFCEFYADNSAWCKRVLRRAALINTPSRFIQSCISTHGFTVQYVPNFIELNLFPFQRKQVSGNSLLWVRAFNDIYHPELAIESVHALKAEFPDIHLTMVGPDQGTQHRCEELIKELGLENDITLTGPIPNHQLASFYQSHAVYLNTTRYESFGVALVEAAACGIPCVSVPVGEIPYLWKDEENMIFCERDTASMAKKIAELLKNPHQAEEIGKKASEKAQDFAWENVRTYWVPTLQQLRMSQKRVA